jgi:hypothetical protein
MSGCIDPAPRLAALQRAFAEALFDPAETVPGGVVGGLTRPARRFHLYRNNVRAGLVETVRARFPAVERLVGEECFRAVARIFVEAHPPRTPALLDYGAAFIPFLAGFAPLRELPYLPDVARLEWLRSRAYHAPDAAPLDTATLAAMPADGLGAARFALHPSAQLFASDYPAVTIWEANAGDGEAGPLLADQGPEAALIVRPLLDVLVLRLGPGGYAFAAALAGRSPLADAVERAAAASPDFSLPDALGALLGAGAICKLGIGNEDQEEVSR